MHPSVPAHGSTGQAPAGSPINSNGRDLRGRFAAGNRGGPGNPFARRTAQLRQFLLDAVSNDDMKIMAAKLVELAKGGDPAAMRLLFSYVIGKPAECVDPDRLDLDEWRLYQESPTIGEVNRAGRKLPATDSCSAASLFQEGRRQFVFAAIGADKARAAEPPSANGAIGRRVARPESSTGVEMTAHATPVASMLRACHPPSADGAIGPAPPSANGANGRAAPSANGSIGAAAPSANGSNGRAPPSANGSNGRAASVATASSG